MQPFVSHTPQEPPLERVLLGSLPPTPNLGFFGVQNCSQPEIPNRLSRHCWAHLGTPKSAYRHKDPTNFWYPPRLGLGTWMCGPSVNVACWAPTFPWSAQSKPLEGSSMGGAHPHGSGNWKRGLERAQPTRPKPKTNSFWSAPKRFYINKHVCIYIYTWMYIIRHTYMYTYIQGSMGFNYPNLHTRRFWAYEVQFRGKLSSCGRTTVSINCTSFWALAQEILKNSSWRPKSSLS